MPELPDVEVFRRRIEDGGLRRTIETVRVSSGALLASTSETTLRDALRRHTLRETARPGNISSRGAASRAVVGSASTSG